MFGPDNHQYGTYSDILCRFARHMCVGVYERNNISNSAISSSMESTDEVLQRWHIFFTIMLLVVSLVSLIKNRMSIKIYQIVLTALMAISTAIAKIIQENEITYSYLFFFVMLLILPCITKFINSNSFNETTIFLLWE